MYHSPMTIVLWETKSSIFERLLHPPLDAPPQTELLTRTPSQSRMSILYNFSTDYILREQYRDAWNEVRIGKLLEDLDALAGTISVKLFSIAKEDMCEDWQVVNVRISTCDFCGVLVASVVFDLSSLSVGVCMIIFPVLVLSYDFINDDSTTRPLYLVTASVDKIVLKKPISVNADLRLDGAVTWVGHLSIKIQLDVTQTTPETADPSDPTALTANFVFVARDYKTGRAASVIRLAPETEREKLLHKEAEAKSKVRKRKLRDEENGGMNKFEALLAEGRIFCDMPALADRDSILLKHTCLENSLICQPQQRNIHGRIFGGFLMHRAFELAFSTAYAFAGMMPSFTEADHVDFLKPVSVDVGDFLRFKSCVLYTEAENSDRPLIHVEVVAHVTRPELRSSEVSNTLYFTFTVRPEAKARNNGHTIRKVVPATEEEARRIIARKSAVSL
ncbi:hypothetical protein SASPL_138186 [Salvia splendens]|uniref:HotDog ACOT-type domain-containing protein n=1 Tax=Salvia splendens TaxID=180675 RepID=A0A8X8WU88_SALSN|nr:hypothetical protein SASPL_138186 [Salvia splendens]